MKSFNQWKSSPIYKAWEHNFTKSKCKILSVKKLGLSAYNNEIKAIFLLVKFLTPEKVEMERSVVLRYPSVVVVPYVKVNGFFKFLCVKQRRLGLGNCSVEFPAGAVEHQSDFVQTAIKELYEETGLIVKQKHLETLNNNLRLMDSFLSERVFWFCCDISKCENGSDYVARKDFNSLTFGATSDEQITIAYFDFAELRKINSMPMKCATTLIQESIL